MSSADVSAALVEAAARIISEEGRPALSNRRVCAAVGTSTMAIYTHFGSNDGLVAAVVDEGFARLADHMRAVSRDDDPLTVLLHLADAYRQNALQNRHLYAVMFSAAATGGGPAEVTRHRRDTFDVLVTAAQSAMDAGLLKPDSAESVAGQLWSALHGYVMLELAGFMRVENDTETTVLRPLLLNLGTALSMPRP